MSDEAKAMDAQREAFVRKNLGAGLGRQWKHQIREVWATLDAERARADAQGHEVTARGQQIASLMRTADEWKARAEKAEADAGRDLSEASDRYDAMCAKWKTACERAEAAEAALARLENFKPTAAQFNALPQALRTYIADVETKCDPANETRSVYEWRDNANALAVKVTELEAALAKVTEERDAIAEKVREVCANAYGGCSCNRGGCEHDEARAHFVARIRSLDLAALLGRES